jgi:hypothetical protein
LFGVSPHAGLPLYQPEATCQDKIPAGVSPKTGGVVMQPFGNGEESEFGKCEGVFPGRKMGKLSGEKEDLLR